MRSWRARNYKHGHKPNSGASPEYLSWLNMLARCYNEKSNSYFRYGAKGIKVCNRWRNSFEAFLEDMGPRPDGHSLERLNNKLGYYPRNCSWATAREQANNRRTNRKITIKGKTKTLAQWSRESSIGVTTIHARIKNGWSEEDAVFYPLRGKD